MHLIEVNENSKYINDIEQVYISAFPEAERTEFKNLLGGFFPNSKLYVLLDNKNFLGFTFVTMNDKILYVVYLAVKGEYRNKGYGTFILNKICGMYSNKAVCLCAEKPETSHDSAIRRIEFYKRNGFELQNIQFDCYGVLFYIMCKGKFDREDFINLMLKCFPVCKDFKEIE